jgi:hypothetical protein
VALADLAAPEGVPVKTRLEHREQVCPARIFRDLRARAIGEPPAQGTMDLRELDRGEPVRPIIRATATLAARTVMRTAADPAQAAPALQGLDLPELALRAVNSYHRGTDPNTAPPSGNQCPPIPTSVDASSYSAHQVTKLV